MIKYVVVAVFSICALPCFAAAQDCGCGGAPTMAAPVMDYGVSSDCGCGAPEPSCCAPRTRKKLALTKVSKEVCRLQRVCSTDCCGCPTSKLVRVKKTVCRTKLTLVDAAPRERCGCSGGRLKGLFGNRGGCGCDSAPSCGCDAPVADCGCGAPAADPCGCGS